jgi:hypothetical protein
VCRELDSCVAALCTDIAQSHTILQVTDQEQLLAWPTAIIHSAENATNIVTVNQMEISINATSGIPKTAHLISEMYEESDQEEGVSCVVTLHVAGNVAPRLGPSQIQSKMNSWGDLGNETGM